MDLARTNGSDEQIRVDLLVVGAGMTGLTAAAMAARRGLEVLLVDKADHLGGSAAMSSGYMWTAPTLEALQGEDPTCDPELGAALADHFLEGIDWVKSLGVECSKIITGIYGFGHGFQTDIATYIDRCKSAVEAGGGWITLGVDVKELTVEDDRVVGCTIADHDGDIIAVKSSWVLLATGSYQGDEDLRVKHLGEQARNMVLRSNPTSAGDGEKLATAVGAITGGGEGYYGHLMAHPLTSLASGDFLSYSQLHSGYCLLLNRAGNRFTDETYGDHVSNQALLAEDGARGIILGDEYVRRTYVKSAYIEGMDVIDKLELARDSGANYAIADSFAEVAGEAARWGYDADQIQTTVEEYNSVVVSDPARLTPSSLRYRRALDEPPYFALEVVPGITFGYGGLVTNVDGEVQSSDGSIPGLLAGGADVGGVYKRGYAGGLARGLVSGMRAAMTAAGDDGWSRAKKSA